MRQVVFAVVLACASTAAADPKRAAAVFALGQADYDAGKYVAAADKFETAYALDPDPAYLFNIAQAHRLGNACAKAAAAYRKFLDIVPSAPNAAKVRQWIEQTDECAKTQEPARPATSEPSTPILPSAPRSEPEPERPPSSPPGRGQRIAGIAIGAAGLVGIGVAAYFTYQASDYTSQREALCAQEIASGGTCQWTEEREQQENALDDKGDRAQLRARIAWGVGGAALVGGVVLYLLAPSAREHTSVTIAPSQGGAMAFGTVRF